MPKVLEIKKKRWPLQTPVWHWQRRPFNKLLWDWEDRYTRYTHKEILQANVLLGLLTIKCFLPVFATIARLEEKKASKRSLPKWFVTKCIDNLANLFIFKSNTYTYMYTTNILYSSFQLRFGMWSCGPGTCFVLSGRCCGGALHSVMCQQCLVKRWEGMVLNASMALDFLEVAASGGGWVYGKGLSSGRFVYSSVLRPQHCVQLHPRPCCRCPRPTWLLPRDTSAHNSAHVALNH